MTHYELMCFKAEETGAIPIDPEQEYVAVSKFGDHLLMYDRSKLGTEFARHFSSDELWGMLDKTWSINCYEDKRGFFACGWSKEWFDSNKQLGGNFQSPQEALLWAVMFEHGYEWHEDTKSFERRDENGTR